MEETILMKADDVGKALQISKQQAYRIIRKLNQGEREQRMHG